MSNAKTYNEKCKKMSGGGAEGFEDTGKYLGSFFLKVFGSILLILLNFLLCPRTCYKNLRYFTKT